MLDVEGFILVGGASSRMGRDKSQLMLGRQTTVEHIADALSDVATRIRLVGARRVDATTEIKLSLYRIWRTHGDRWAGFRRRLMPPKPNGAL